ncbi:hypothetical protein KBB48_01070 [Candidatus Shapirobacteria bacterium]|nr:hypothetical protein [Candidatus Shapirobacteria bacterium]
MIKKSPLPDKLFGISTQLILLWAKPVILGLILIMSIILVIVPKIGEINGKFKEISSTTAKRKDVMQKITYLSSIDQEEIKNNADLLASGVLAEKSAYLLVNVVRNAASEVGYSVDDFAISLGEVKKQEKNEKTSNKTLGYDTIPVKMTVSGPQEKYLDLAKTIERSLPVISIDNFEMNSGSNGGVTIKLNVSAYYLQEALGINPENLSLADLTPSQEEADLLSLIREYRPMTGQSSQQNESGSFIKYERKDPFFTP